LVWCGYGSNLLDGLAQQPQGPEVHVCARVWGNLRDAGTEYPTRWGNRSTGLSGSLEANVVGEIPCHVREGNFRGVSIRGSVYYNP
jgi:hypothetical protein